MTFHAKLLASTAAALIATSGIAWAENHPVTGEPLAEDQSFSYSVLDDFASIDPQTVEGVEGGAVARDLFEGLLNEDADGNPVPGVAESWEVSDDGLTYTFHLRDNAKWSNGDPVLAGDFVYGLRRAADPETASPYAWYLEVMGVDNASEVIAGDLPVEDLGISAPDDYTVVYKIDAPRPYFPQMLTFPTTFPANQAAIEAAGDEYVSPGNLVSNGAYVLSEYVPGEKLTRSRNEMYWNNDATIIDEVTALIINDSNLALTRYLAGEIDYVTDVPAGQYPRLSSEYPDQAMSFPSSCSYYYYINHSDSGNPALQDPRVREALSLAVDRGVIVNNILAGGQREAYTFTHWAVAGWEAPELDIMNMTQEERNARAQELMAEAGYGNGGEPLTVSILFNTSESHRSIAVAIGQMWKQTLGVEAELSNQEWSTYLDTRSQQNFEVSRAGWCADYNEPSTYLDLLTSASSYNDGKYVNEQVDALMEEAKTSDNPMPLYQEVEAIASADTAIIPIYHYASVRMKSPHLANWPVTNFLQNWYSKDLYITADE